ncbi:hypothetical protein NLN84_23760, partial [Citrobacter portucalensis]|uniref:hypothetical protein n=1 Tax=Citrobacter portucalensis TaxID=1639133 RepID=UPI00226B8DAF
YYIRHPKNSRTNILIPARQFHEFIIREQISDIVDYIRANTTATLIDIEVESFDNAEISLGGIIEGLSVDTKSSINKKQKHRVTISCNGYLKPSEKKKISYG